MYKQAAQQMPANLENVGWLRLREMLHELADRIAFSALPARQGRSYSANPHGGSKGARRRYVFVAPNTPGPQAAPAPRKILIVDDSKSTTRALSALLKSASYDTAVAHRGSEALDLARHADGYAAALVDIHLPDISGLLVAQKLRELLGPDVPIFVLSGDTSMQMLNSLPHVGATYFFSKPVNSAHLLERMAVWTARQT
jgi:CheY-like chemotaxis protein